MASLRNTALSLLHRMHLPNIQRAVNYLNRHPERHGSPPRRPGVRPGIVGGDALRCGREEPTKERPGVPARLRAETGPQEAPAAAP